MYTHIHIRVHMYVYIYIYIYVYDMYIYIYMFKRVLAMTKRGHRLRPLRDAGPALGRLLTALKYYSNDDVHDCYVS